MWTLTYSIPQKAGIILYGLVVGIGAVLATDLLCFVLATGIFFIVSLIGGRGEGGAFFLAASLIYGFYVGVPVGLVVWWKVCRSRLREVSPEQSRS